MHRNQTMPSKRYKDALGKLNGDGPRSLTDAVNVLAGFPKAKFDESVDLALRLGVDPKHSDQMVRGTVSLPHGSGKTVRVAAFAPDGPQADAAKEAGADFVGMAELIKKVEGGWTDFDVAVATPEAMKAGVAKLGRVLGPRNLMPTPKAGTVTEDISKAVTDVKGGQISFKVDKSANLHLQIAKASFSPEQIVDNVRAAMDAVNKAKPDTCKGVYLQSATISTTMSPGVKLDLKDLQS